MLKLKRAYNMTIPIRLWSICISQTNKAKILRESPDRLARNRCACFQSFLSNASNRLKQPNSWRKLTTYFHHLAALFFTNEKASARTITLRRKQPQGTISSTSFEVANFSRAILSIHLINKRRPACPPPQTPTKQSVANSISLTQLTSNVNESYPQAFLILTGRVINIHILG